MILEITLSFTFFLIIELLLCCVLLILFKKLGRLSIQKRRLYSPYVVVLLLLIIATGIAYIKWEPAKLLIVEDCEKSAPSYHKYFIIMDYMTPEGINISSSGNNSYIYNGSNYQLLFREYTYGYKGGEYKTIRSKTVVNVKSLPDYYFTNQWPQPIIRTTSYDKRISRFYIDFDDNRLNKER